MTNQPDFQQKAREWLRTNKTGSEHFGSDDNRYDNLIIPEKKGTDSLADLLRSVYEERLEDAAKKVRADCIACDGDGYANDGDECEYCGRPMRAIRNLSEEQE